MSPLSQPANLSISQRVKTAFLCSLLFICLHSHTCVMYQLIAFMIGAKLLRRMCWPIGSMYMDTRLFT